MWVPPEDRDPVLPMVPTRKSVSLFGAVNVADGRLVTQLEKHFNALTFQSFLVTLLRRLRRNRKMLILLDNARYHHATGPEAIFQTSPPASEVRILTGL